MFYKHTLLVTIYVSFVSCANILGIIPIPMFSHQVAFFDLWSELSLRGHQVTVITTNPQKNKKFTNLTEIDMNWTYEFFKDIGSKAEKTMTMWNFDFWLTNVSCCLLQAHFSDRQIQDLVYHKKNFDVLLLEAHNPESLYFAEFYDCPVILVSSSDVFSNVYYKMGNPMHPILNPTLISNFCPPLNFQESIISLCHSFYTMFFNKYIGYPNREAIAQHFFNSTSTIDGLLDKVDMLFYNVNPVLHSVKATGPSTIDIAGIRRLSAQPLPQDLQKFLDSATDGFVYFSLGSNVKSKDLTKESLRSIVETLRELPCKVLWKFEAEPGAITNQPDNVKLIKWAPQLGVLAHPNIKVFVTQGGLQSMEEAVHNKVPCVVIPFFADQEQNSKLMKNKGFATIVRRYPYIKKDELRTAILEVLNNLKYKDAVIELNRLASDTPMTGLEKAIWWTEYVIRNKGAKHLRNPAADLPLYQYYLLDVIGFLLTMVLITLSVSFVVLIKICAIFRTIVWRRSILVKKKL